MKILDEVHGKDSCPHCKASMVGRDIVLALLESQGGHYDCDSAWKTAMECYGYDDPNEPQYFYRVIGVECSQWRYDGVAWWMCPECSGLWKRFPWSKVEWLEGLDL